MHTGFHGIPGKDVPKGKELDYLNTHFNRNRTDGRSEEEKRRDEYVSQSNMSAILKSCNKLPTSI